MKHWIWFTCLLTLSMAHATIINVPADSSTIQSGIIGASDGDTVLVQPGTYVENINLYAKRITLGSLTLTTGDTAYISQTIIDGDASGSVVRFESGEDSTTILHGFTITTGRAEFGGGIYCNESSPKLVDLVVSCNEGDGVYSSEGSNPSLVDVVVCHNSGSGLSCENSSPSLVNAIVSENSGSGITCYNSNPSLLNVTVSNNDGSGVSCENSSSILVNVTISGNVGIPTGGGIDCSSSNLSLINVTISGNSAEGIGAAHWYDPGTGGGIFCDSSYLSLENVIVTGNSADDMGGGIYFRNTNELLAVAITVSENSAGSSGGGIYFENSNPNLANMTVTGNSAESEGGGIYFSNSNPSFDPVNRCNIYFNQATYAQDLYAWFDTLVTTIQIVVDTFTVMCANDYYAFPRESYTFNILHAKLEQVAADLYVSPDGDDDNGGLSLLDPLKTFNRAMSIILADSLNPQKIYLAGGTYSPSISGETFPVRMIDYVSLFGTVEDSVILDAESRGNVLEFRLAQGITIENLNITGGSADWAGGAIYCSENSNPSLVNMKVSGNAGTGISCENSSPSLLNVTVSGNDGSGISCRENSNPSLLNVTVSGNTGTGISCEYSSPSLMNVTVSGNNGSGISCRENSSPSLMNVTVSGNAETGISCENSSPSLLNVTVSRNIGSGFSNSAVMYGYGGGIYCSDNSRLSLVNVKVTDNSAYRAGGIYCENSSLTMEMVMVTGNSVESAGGGIFCDNSSVTLELVTVNNNSAGVVGGGFYCLDSSPSLNVINRCNIYHNQARDGQDLCARFSSDTTFHVVVDTFTVLNPTEKYAHPLENFTFDILHAKEPLDTRGSESIPSEFALHQNYPNPFNPVSTIRYDLPQASDVSLIVYDILGREVMRLVDGHIEPGYHKVQWDGRNTNGQELPTGLYIASLVTPEYTESIKMMLLR